MFIPINQVKDTIDVNGIPNTDRVVKVQVYGAYDGVSEIYGPDG